MGKSDKVTHKFVPKQGSSLCHYRKSVEVPLLGLTIVGKDTCLRPRWKHVSLEEI